MGKASWRLKDLSEQLNFQRLTAKTTRSRCWIQNIWLYLIGLWSGKCILELCSTGRQKISHESSLVSTTKIQGGKRSLKIRLLSEPGVSLLEKVMSLIFHRLRGNIQVVLPQCLLLSPTCLSAAVCCWLAGLWGFILMSPDHHRMKNQFIYGCPILMIIWKLPVCSVSFFFGLVIFGISPKA